MDKSFLLDMNTKKYLEKVCEDKHINQLDKMFPNANNETMTLLKGLLEINPYFRLSAKEAINSQVFDQIRNKQV